MMLRRTPARRALLVCVALAVASSITSRAAPAQEPQRPSAPRAGASAIGAELAAATFDSAWSRIERTYFDSTFGGLDWGAVRHELRPKATGARTLAELRGVIDEMLGRLRASHFVLIRQELLGGAAADTGDGPSGMQGDAGMELRAIGAVPVVWRVRPGGPADRAGIAPGWTIDSIGTASARPALVAAERAESPRERRLLRVGAIARTQRALVGEVGDSVVVHVRDGGDAVARRALVLEEAPGVVMRFGSLPPIRTRVDAERRPLSAAEGGGCAGVVRLSVWLPAAMPRLIAALDSVRDCRGIVLDLRGNPGGVAGMSMGLGGYFLEEAVPLGTMRTRTGELRLTVNPRRTTPAGEPTRPFDGPVAILVDEMSASTSEIFAGGMQALGRAVVVGDTTAGQALPAMVYSLPTGDVLMHAFADFTAPDGARLEGRGAIPDLVVPLRRADLLARRDAALLAAIDRIVARAARR